MHEQNSLYRVISNFYDCIRMLFLTDNVQLIYKEKQNTDKYAIQSPNTETKQISKS